MPAILARYSVNILKGKFEEDIHIAFDIFIKIKI